MRAVRTYEPVNCGEDFLPFVPFRLVKYAEPIRPRLEASVRLVIPDGSRDRPREKSRRGRLFCFPKTSHHSQDLVNPSRNETLPAGPEEERGEGVLLDTKDAPSRLLLWDGWLWTLLLFPSLPEFKIAAAEGRNVSGQNCFPESVIQFPRHPLPSAKFPTNFHLFLFPPFTPMGRGRNRGCGFDGCPPELLCSSKPHPLQNYTTVI